MNRKNWINNLTDEEAEKIHVTFRQLDKTLFALPMFNFKAANIIKDLQKAYPRENNPLGQYRQQRRTIVRNFLRKHHITQRKLNEQYGRLAAGFGLNLKLNTAI